MPDQPQRIRSIDIVRGIVMLIMAIDHVRDFFHVNAMTDDPTNMTTTTPALFFTRWITHFCAPVFVFLSGTSAYLAARRKTAAQASGFLIKRGIWLIIVELAVITLLLTYNPFYNFLLLEVIWAIGCSMIVLGLLLRTNWWAIFITGLLLVFGHNILDFVSLPPTGAANVLWSILFTSPGRVFPLTASHFLLDGYAILPWTGIMLLGYSFGKIYTVQPDVAKRRKTILQLGAGVVLLFVVLRFVNLYGDPNPWSVQKDGVFTVLSFLNTTKYPPSLMYACMTLGPALIALALLEKTQSSFSSILSMYGRVPFFYFVLHLFVIRTLLVVVFFASGYSAQDISSPNLPFFFRPPQFGFSLPVVYAIWLFVIVVLYIPCKWFNHYRSTHRQWWLSYV